MLANAAITLLNSIKSSPCASPPGGGGEGGGGAEGGSW